MEVTFCPPFGVLVKAQLRNLQNMSLSPFLGTKSDNSLSNHIKILPDKLQGLVQAFVRTQRRAHTENHVTLIPLWFFKTYTVLYFYLALFLCYTVQKYNKAHAFHNSHHFCGRAERWGNSSKSAQGCWMGKVSSN